MKTSNMKWTRTWGVIAVAAIVLLLVAGAVYAQGFGRGRGQAPGGRQGPGMGRGPGAGPGPGGFGGMAYFMMDQEIRDLLGQIKLISGLNEIAATPEQVEVFLDCAREAQALLDEEFGDVRDDVRRGLNDQLDLVLGGETFDESLLENLRDQIQATHEPGALREQLGVILDRAIDVLTEEQQQMIVESMGERREDIRGRLQKRFGDRAGRMERRFERLSEEERESIRERFQDRIQEMQVGAAKMKVMMMLLAPQSIEAMEMWLDANT